MELSKSCLCLYPSMQFVQLVKGPGDLVVSEVWTKRDGAIRIMSIYAIVLRGCEHARFRVEVFMRHIIYRLNFHSCSSHNSSNDRHHSGRKRIYFSKWSSHKAWWSYHNYLLVQFVQLVKRQGRGCRLSEVRTKRGGAVRIMSWSESRNSYNSVVKRWASLRAWVIWI